MLQLDDPSSKISKPLSGIETMNFAGTQNAESSSKISKPLSGIETPKNAHGVR